MEFTAAFNTFSVLFLGQNGCERREWRVESRYSGTGAALLGPHRRIREPKSEWSLSQKLSNASFQTDFRGTEAFFRAHHLVPRPILGKPRAGEMSRSAIGWPSEWQMWRFVLELRRWLPKVNTDRLKCSVTAAGPRGRGGWFQDGGLSSSLLSARPTPVGFLSAGQQPLVTERVRDATSTRPPLLVCLTLRFLSRWR